MLVGVVGGESLIWCKKTYTKQCPTTTPYLKIEHHTLSLPIWLEQKCVLFKIYFIVQIIQVHSKIANMQKPDQQLYFYKKVK